VLAESKKAEKAKVVKKVKAKPVVITILKTRLDENGDEESDDICRLP
jgi:ribose 1,5-bisphosphokinase PhnN